MDFTKLGEHYNWSTNDLACLHIRDTADAVRPPREFVCKIIGQTGVLRPQALTVPTQNLTFLGAGVFGPAREATENSPGWTGDPLRFGIYGYQFRCGYREHIVILRSDGGFDAYVDVSLTAAEMWHHLCETCTPEMLWNICTCIVHTYDLAEENGRHSMLRAFDQGKLRKRQGRNGIQVHLLPKSR